MKGKQFLAGLLAFAVVMTGTVHIPSLQASAQTKEAAGTTYYVSTVDGNDKNDGLSEDQAFYSLNKINEKTLKPGDKVLLECGSVFKNGYLHIKGSGSAEAPIVIDRYGTGAAPVISTNGKGVWYQDYGKQLDSSAHKYKGYVSSSVLLYDVEYIEINNLEITNEAPAIEAVYNAQDVMNRTGVAAVAQNIGTVDHIYLNNLYVHDVIGNVYDKHMNNGGIYFTEFLPKNAATGIARYDDIRIENCYVDNVNRWGIAVGYTYNWDRFTTAALSDDTMATYAATNVVIRNNYIKDAGGDAITTMYCDRPLVEYNVSDAAARQINPTDYSATGSGRVAAAIWPWKCKDAVFQYNEVFDTCYNQDSQAWDADYGDGTIYQYNYSHNNGGGSVMFCGVQAINNIFRYNISQNDLGGVINPAGQPDAHVYNNTFYVKEGIDFIRTNMGGGPMVVENNIIYYSGETAKEENWFKHTSADKTKYDNNIYYNYTAAPSNDEHAIMEDPKFAAPGEAPTQPLDVEAGNITKSIIHERTAFDGYKVKEDSPAVNAGKYIADNGGKDFFGNEVIGVPNIGAYDSKIDMTDLEVLIEQAEALNEADYISGWAKMQEALKAAKVLCEEQSTDAKEIEAACRALNTALNGLTKMKFEISYIEGKLVMSTNVADGQIRYTLDGTEPNRYSPLYSGEVAIAGKILGECKVRARVFLDGKPYGNEEEKVLSFGSLSTQAAATATNYHSSPFTAEKAVDGDQSTRWATSNGITAAKLTLTFKQPVSVNRFEITQFYGATNYITDYAIEYLTEDGTYETAFTETGANSKKALSGSFDSVTSTVFVLNITDSMHPSIFEFSLFGENAALSDRTSLEALLESAEQLKASDYTAESWMAVENAVKAAIEALNDPFAAQAAVDEAEAALQNAIDALKEAVTEDIMKNFKVIVNGKLFGEYKYNEKVTVTAEETENFTGWFYNGAIVSEETAYTFYVMGDMELTAVYGETEQRPSVILSNPLAIKDGTKTSLRFPAQIVVPDGYKLTDAGLVWSSKETPAVLEVGAEGARQTAVKTVNKQYQFSVTINGVPEGRYVRGVIYAKLLTPDNKEEVYYYSVERKGTN